jgi:hypothetical protein
MIAVLAAASVAVAPWLVSDHHIEHSPANAPALCAEALKVGYVMGVKRVEFRFSDGKLVCETGKAPAFEVGK